MTPQRRKKLEANIWKAQVAQFFRWMLFFIPILIPFLIDKGLSLTEVFTLQAAYSVTVVLLEIPSGYFADVHGRKISLILGGTFSVLGIIFYGIGNSFVLFLLAEILFGVGSAFKSGADEAILYDTLVELGREKEYVRYSGRMEFLGRIGEASASLFGGLLTAIALSLPFWITSIALSITVLIMSTMIEPVHEKHVGKHMKQLWTIFMDSVHHNVSLKWILVYATIIGVATRSAVWLYQPLYGQAGVPLAWYGVLWAIALIVSGICSWVAERTDLHVGRHRMLWILAICVIGGYSISGLVAPAIAIGTTLLLQIVRGLGRPVINEEINALTHTSRRATVLSIRSFLHNIVFAIIIVFMGVLAEKSLQLTFILGGIIFGFGAVIALFFTLKNHRSKNTPSL